MTKPTVPYAVVFDFYGTLTDPRNESDRRHVLDTTAVALGVDPVSFRAATSASFDRRCRGLLGDTRATLQQLAERCGRTIDAPTLDRALAVHLGSYRALTEPHPSALSVLDWLRGLGCRVGVLTDCSTEFPEIWAATTWPQHVDAVTFSAVLGHRKPDSAGYLDIARRLGVDPSACWFVGEQQRARRGSCRGYATGACGQHGARRRAPAGGPGLISPGRRHRRSRGPARSAQAPSQLINAADTASGSSSCGRWPDPGISTCRCSAGV